MLTGDPCDPIFQVRLVIGDTDSDLVGDEVIDYALTQANQNIRKASILSLQYIVAHVANQMSHSVGDVWIDNKKLYDQLKDLLSTVISDSNYATNIIIGGVSKAAAKANRDDTDFVGSPVQSSHYT